jgi:hypothetical protein
MYAARQKLQEEHDERAKVYAERLKEVCSYIFIYEHFYQFIPCFRRLRLTGTHVYNSHFQILETDAVKTFLYSSCSHKNVLNV